MAYLLYRMAQHNTRTTMIKLRKLLDLIRRYEHFILFEFHNLSLFTSEWINATELRLSSTINALITDQVAEFHFKNIELKVDNILVVIKDGEDKEFFQKLSNEIKQL